MVPLVVDLHQNLRVIQEYGYQVLSMGLIIAGTFFHSRPIKRDNFLISIGIAGLVMLFVYYHVQIGVSIMFNALLGVCVFLTLIRTLEKKHIELVLKTFIGLCVFAIIYKWLQDAFGYDLRGQHAIDVQGRHLAPDTSYFGLKGIYGIFLATLSPLILFYLPSLFTFIDIRSTESRKVMAVMMNICKVLLTGFIISALFVFVAISYSTGACLAFICSVLFFMWFKKRQVFWFLAIPLVIAFSMYLVKMDNPMGMQKSRLDVWGKTIQDSWVTPLGHGLDSFANPGIKINPSIELTRYFKNAFNDKTVRVKKKYNITNIDMQDWHTVEPISADDEAEFMKRHAEGNPMIDFWDHPHNEYIWFFYETGFPGLISMIFLILMFWRRFWQSMKHDKLLIVTSSIIAFGISSLTYFPLHLARVAYLLPVLGALFFILSEKDIKEGNGFYKF